MEDLSMSGKRPFMSGKRPFISRKMSTYCQENVHINPLRTRLHKACKGPININLKIYIKLKKEHYLWITLFLTFFFTIVDLGD